VNPLDQALLRWARASVTQPLSCPVAANDAAYLRDTGFRKLGFRAWRKEIAFVLSGQGPHEVHAIDPTWKRGLWLYTGVPQIGDALMDLAPRSLLTEQGIQLDLLTHPHLAELFQADPWFTTVTALAPNGTCRPSTRSPPFDFVIVPSHKHRSLQYKRGPLSALPWVSMHGRYTGPEFQRAEFAARRLADLLSIQPEAQTFARHARAKLGVPTTAPSPAGLCIVVGGVDPSRSYPHWGQVVQALRRHGVTSITLLGSTNGQAAAAAAEAAWDGAPGLLNRVGKTTLQDCTEALSNAAHVVAADGGLMHMAVALGRSVTALFTATVSPSWRLPPDLVGTSLQSATSLVGDIDPAAVALAVMRTLDGSAPTNPSQASRAASARHP